MCSGAILLYKIPRLVIGENRNFVGEEALLRSRGVEVVILDDPECIELMERFINEKPEVSVHNSVLWVVAEPEWVRWSTTGTHYRTLLRNGTKILGRRCPSKSREKKSTQCMPAFRLRGVISSVLTRKYVHTGCAEHRRWHGDKRKSECTQARSCTYWSSRHHLMLFWTTTGIDNL